MKSNRNLSRSVWVDPQMSLQKNNSSNTSYHKPVKFIHNKNYLLTVFWMENPQFKS